MSANGNNQEAIRSLFNLIDQTEYVENGTSPNLMGTFGVTNEAKCYIKETPLDCGETEIQLYEKETHRPVTIKLEGDESQRHFTDFLTVMYGERHQFTALTSPTDMKDYIGVSGTRLVDSNSEIAFADDHRLSYLIK